MGASSQHLNYAETIASGEKGGYFRILSTFPDSLFNLAENNFRKEMNSGGRYLPLGNAMGEKKRETHSKENQGIFRGERELAKRLPPSQL